MITILKRKQDNINIQKHILQALSDLVMVYEDSSIKCLPTIIKAYEFAIEDATRFDLDC